MSRRAAPATARFARHPRETASLGALRERPPTRSHAALCHSQTPLKTLRGRPRSRTEFARPCCGRIAHPDRLVGSGSRQLAFSPCPRTLGPPPSSCKQATITQSCEHCNRSGWLAVAVSSGLLATEPTDPNSDKQTRCAHPGKELSSSGLR